MRLEVEHIIYIYILKYPKGISKPFCRPTLFGRQCFLFEGPGVASEILAFNVGKRVLPGRSWKVFAW